MPAHEHVARAASDLASPFRQLEPYLVLLERHALDGARTDLRAHLDGRPSAEVRRAVPLAVRRGFGTFLTTSPMRAAALRLLRSIGDGAEGYLDPTCGAGDLLLEAAQFLPTRRNVSQTIELWDERLKGFDVVPELVRAARARLVLLARARTNDWGALGARPRDWFPSIQVGDGLEFLRDHAVATNVLLNPPFGTVDAPAECPFASGIVSASAIFSWASVEALEPGGRLVAILPDVLRSGSRYRRWREGIESMATIRRVRTFERFDTWTDVHVFALVAEGGRGGSRRARWIAPVPDKDRVSDQFDVSVGSVVPYRDPKRGPRRPYVHAQSLPPTGEIIDLPEQRRYEGRAVQPPFIVVRRTSRPSTEGSRLRANIIRGNASVFVENHLIVIRPKDRTLRSCRALLAHLLSPAVTSHLNDRIRCRHLTVSAIRDLPYVHV